MKTILLRSLKHHLSITQLKVNRVEHEENEAQNATMEFGVSFECEIEPVDDTTTPPNWPEISNESFALRWFTTAAGPKPNDFTIVTTESTVNETEEKKFHMLSGSIEV